MKCKTDYTEVDMADTEDMVHIRLGSNLKYLMSARGLSLTQISSATGIPYSTLHTWLDNRQPKDIVKVKILSDHLGADLHDLLFGTVERNPADSKTPWLPHSETLEGIYEITVRRRDK